MQVHGRGHAVEVGLTERELACQEIDEVARAVERDLEPDRRAIASLREFAFERAAQVLRFLLVDEQVAVAGQAEGMAFEDPHAVEQARHEFLDDGREQHEALRAAALLRQRHHPRQGTRRLYDRKGGLTAVGVLALEAYDEVEALVLDARERSRWVECERREHRLDLTLEVACEPTVDRAERLARQQRKPCIGEFRQQLLVEAGVLVGDQPCRACVDRLELRGGRRPVRADKMGRVLEPLLHARDTDLEEFVQVAR